MGEIFGFTKRRARKPHRCYWCGEIIERGDEYFSWVYKEGGDIPDRIRVHPECSSAWSEAAFEEGDLYRTGPGEHQRGKTLLKGERE